MSKQNIHIKYDPQLQNVGLFNTRCQLYKMCQNKPKKYNFPNI